MENRYCFVPSCKNSSTNCPNKMFVRIREDLREKWCREVNVEYHKVYTMYCCEDHINPYEDLKNYHKYKLMNQEPIFKSTAILRNITMIATEPENIPLPQDTELSKLLLECPMESIQISAKKRKLGVIPSTSTAFETPIQVHVGTQCKVTMIDKSTNYKTRKQVSTSATLEIHSSQELSSATPATNSLFSYTSGTEETTIEKCKKETLNRNRMLELIFKKPKMYLGLPKQYLWFIDYIVKKSTTNIDCICVIATLFKIKQNDSLERISDQLELSRTKLSSMIFRGIEVLASFFQNIIFCPQPKQIKKNLPLVFKIRYSSVQMIIDCFEIQIAKPSDPLKQAQTWSQYKNCNTVKYLIGCTPNGLISFVSKGFGGRISDKAILEKSSLVDNLQPNAVILADRGFKEIESLLNSHGITLLRPPSVYAGIRPSLGETIKSKVIASLRVHVERVIRRVREFALLKPHSVVNYKYVPFLDEVVIISCGLINLQGEIIKNC